MTSNIITFLSLNAIAQSTFTIEDLGKEYTPPEEKLLEGMYYHIEKDKDVCGGNTSIRNVDEANLGWKGKRSGNGFGYFKRNRDLGQVFCVKKGFTVIPDALVLRTSKGHKAIRIGALGAEMFIVFFEVREKEGQKLRINENGTTKGDSATHGYDHSHNRCDDYIEGAEYIFLHRSTGGIFPTIEPTTQFTYERVKGEPYGEQPGHLRYIRFDFADNMDLRFAGGKRYAFLVGFIRPAKERRIALANRTYTYIQEPAEFIKDVNGNITWGIRREGNGVTPPLMVEQTSPPSNPELYNQLVKESLFPENHYDTLTPTSEGYPDVDTYRTLQYYFELSESKQTKD